jgi:hypothetical protein
MHRLDIITFFWTCTITPDNGYIIEKGCVLPFFCQQVGEKRQVLHLYTGLVYTTANNVVFTVTPLKKGVTAVL